MSRAGTAKPPALAMPSRRAAVSAGFPVRRRRPDAGDCRHQGEYAGACPLWTGSLFLCLFSFFLLPKGRYLPKHGLRGGLLRMRTGRAGEMTRPGRRPQARPALRGAMPRGAEGGRTVVPLLVERKVVCGAGHFPAYGRENAVRLVPGGTVMAVWENRLAVHCRPALGCPLTARGKPGR